MSLVPVVLDMGSSIVRAGLANGATPTAIFPTIISHVNGATLVGNDAKTSDAPKKKLDFFNCDHVESVCLHAFNQLGTGSKDKSIVSNDFGYPFTTYFKQKIVQVIFEKLNIEALYINNQSVLSLYSHGRLSGLVLDSGFTESQVYPIYEGHILE